MAPTQKFVILIQASSRSWAGGADLCMNPVGYAETSLQYVIEKAKTRFPTASLRIIAPEFDYGGRIGNIVSRHFSDISVYYSHDASPLRRMIVATEDLHDDEYILRIDGIHFGWVEAYAEDMLRLAMSNAFDCVKMPDDFPIALTSDVYRVGAMRNALKILSNSEGEYHVHPKYFLFSRPELFSCARLQGFSPPDEGELMRLRILGETVHRIRDNVSLEKALPVGSQLIFHYELALERLNAEDIVLDMACGSGWGTRILAEKAKKATGVDLEAGVLPGGRVSLPANLKFMVEDVTSMSFVADAFDAITAFEILEHIDAAACLAETRRVLKPGGRLMLSTPQNSLGEIPLNTSHLREYSLEELRTLCARYFSIEEIVGIKQGRIIIPGDHLGQNTYMLCRKVA